MALRNEMPPVPNLDFLKNHCFQGNRDAFLYRAKPLPSVQSVLRPLFGTLWSHFASNSVFLLRFQKKGATRSQVCRTALIRSALKSPDPGASNGGSNVGIRHFEADVITFEMSELPKIKGILSTFLPIPNPISWQPISKLNRSAPWSRISTFDPPFYAPGSEFSSAL